MLHTAQSNHTKVSNQNSSPTAAEKKYKYTPNDRKSAGDDSLEMIHNNVNSKSKEPGGAGSNVGGGSSSSSKNPSPADYDLQKYRARSNCSHALHVFCLR